MKKLSWIEISFLYIGVIMGAGFVSGRESWQFFGVFGNKGYYGVIASTIGFVILSCMLTYIARSKGTADLGKMISPIDNKTVEAIIGWTLAIIYYSVVVAMTAAGGSLLSQQFGISKLVGGLLIAILVILTVLGDFQRISKIFRYMVPILFAIALLTVSMTLMADFSQSGQVTGFEPGRMSPNWISSAIVFMSYNSLGMITMSGNSAINARDAKNAYLGSIFGTICLGGLTMILLKAILSDMAFTSSLDLPMLGFSLRISSFLNFIFAIILYGAIYSAGASIYYGFTTMIRPSKHKKLIVITGAIAAFVLGLTGFKTLVELLYPIQGYLGIIIIFLIMMNFAKAVIAKRKL